MDWKTFHHAAEEAELWTTLVINTWAILTALALGVTKLAGRQITVSNLLVIAGATAFLVAYFVGGAMLWGWLILALLYQHGLHVPAWLGYAVFVVFAGLGIWSLAAALRREARR